MESKFESNINLDSKDIGHLNKIKIEPCLNLKTIEF
jgi:hypothetical protein